MDQINLSREIDLTKFAAPSPDRRGSWKRDSSSFDFTEFENVASFLFEAEQAKPFVATAS
jgi:hypothetical protein